MISELLLLICLALGTQAVDQCGAPQCYFPCTDARPQVDIVFLIDVSGSMDSYIQAIITGLTGFVNGLNNNQVNPAFAVVLYGDNNNNGAAALQFPLSTSATSFKNFMTQHNCILRSSCSGGYEAGLEALNQIMNKANTNNMNIAFRSSQNAKKVFIVLTNEDSDLARNSADYYGIQPNGVGTDYYCYQLPGGYGSSYHSITSSQWPSWQQEINAVANNIISMDANLYMFAAGAASLSSSASSHPFFYQTCNTMYQYCNVDKQSMSADYSNFNPTTTYNNFVSEGSQNSLQGQLLNAGKISRCFEVNALLGSASQVTALVNNFFTQITADLSKCDTTCYNYTCITSTTCAPPVLKCDCNGVPYTSGGTATLDKNGVCCAAAQHDVNNVCCTGALDQCKVCTSNGAASPNCKQDCANQWYLTTTTAPPHHTDECGNCVAAGTTRSATCQQDCAQSWYDSAHVSAPHITDNCGYCVTAGTNVDAHKDSCGVCDGGNAAKNQCGVCFGATGNDACGHPVCQAQTCNKDCDGVFRSPLEKHIDECNNCVPLAETRDPGCVQDCAGAWYNQGTTPPHHTDECGNCIEAAVVRAPGCVKDCNNVWGGTAYLDNCNQCVVNGVPPGVCQKDCAGIYYIVGNTPPHSVDSCGICNTPANQNSLFDHCNMCTNTPGYNSTAQCTQDCKGVWRLVTDPHRAFVDGCGSCWTYDQTNMYNYLMDDCGVCFPARNAPGWNQESTGKDSQGVVCKCFTTPLPCQGGSATTCNDNCPPACTVNGTVMAFDNCGRCPGDPYFNTPLDDCGVCATANHTANSDKDSCGVCFGGDAKKLTNPCHLCDASQCVVDCAGTPNGDKVYDCAGVCGGTNTVCSVCGDGNRTTGEECDLGPQNGQSGSGCTADCHAVAGQNVGAIAGGIVGALVGLVVLGLAAFLALQYAKKNGLIGNANKQLDMASSNSNPLYKSEVNVQHNPLYGQS